MIPWSQSTESLFRLATTLALKTKSGHSGLFGLLSNQPLAYDVLVYLIQSTLHPVIKRVFVPLQSVPSSAYKVHAV